jgi:hypothetical protein
MVSSLSYLSLIFNKNVNKHPFHSKILWNARVIGRSRSLVTIDGTDMPVALGFNKGFFGVKFNHSGLKYEVGVSIETGYIVWINGPFRCGQNDITISRTALIGALDVEEEEMAVADSGYKGEVHHIRTPNVGTAEERQMQDLARARHETVNCRLKIFNVLGAGYFRHDLTFHSSCFRAVAVITQLTFENGGEPFQVDFHDLE